MYANSRPVDSNQAFSHPRLPLLLAKYAQHPYRKPVSANSQRLFEAVDELRRQLDKPVILDSGCGTGQSTRWLARQYPHCLVIGVDKSAHRLARGGCASQLVKRDNLLLARCDLVDFWRLCQGAGWQLHRHLLWFPNPWPKQSQLARRWHAHPVFPSLLALGGALELRCNWRAYAEEFALSVRLLSGRSCDCRQYQPSTTVSPFEQKYHASGHSLYQCLA